MLVESDKKKKHEEGYRPGFYNDTAWLLLNTRGHRGVFTVSIPLYQVMEEGIKAMLTLARL